MSFLNAAGWGLAVQILCGCTLIYDSKPIPADAGQDMSADSDAEVDPASDDVSVEDPAPVDPPFEEIIDDRVDPTDMPADEEPEEYCGSSVLGIADTFFTVTSVDRAYEVPLPDATLGFRCLHWEFDMVMPFLDEGDGCETPRGISEVTAGGRLLGGAYISHMRRDIDENCTDMPQAILSAQSWPDPSDSGTWLGTVETHAWETDHTYHVTIELSLDDRIFTVALSEGGIAVGPQVVLDVSEAGYACAETGDAVIRFGMGPEVTTFTAYTNAAYSNLQVSALACP